MLLLLAGLVLMGASQQDASSLVLSSLTGANNAIVAVREAEYVANDPRANKLIGQCVYNGLAGDTMPVSLLLAGQSGAQGKMVKVATNVQRALNQVRADSKGDQAAQLVDWTVVSISIASDVHSQLGAALERAGPNTGLVFVIDVVGQADRFERFKVLESILDDTSPVPIRRGTNTYHCNRCVFVLASDLGAPALQEKAASMQNRALRPHEVRRIVHADAKRNSWSDRILQKITCSIPVQ